MAVALCCVILFLSLLGASPALHLRLHHDANEPGHTCVIELFANSLVTGPGIIVIVALAGLLFGGVSVLQECARLSSFDYRFAQSRAPPVYLR